jgi:hypothetical protein
MQFTLRLLFVAIFPFGLAACGSSSSGNPSTTPPVARDVAVLELRNPMPDDITFTVSSDGSTGDVSVTTGGVTTTHTAKSVYLDGQFHLPFHGGEKAVFIKPDSGNGAAVAIASANGSYTGTAVDGVFFERFGNTDVPTDTTVTYLGSYRGIVDDVRGLTLRNDPVVGLLRLDVEFTPGGGEVSGVINNRVWERAGPGDSTFRPNLPDIRLNAAPIIDGGFEGGVPAGRYAGMFIGPDGAEVLGGILRGSCPDNCSLTEYGIFYGDDSR